jgi:hypothetical protein
VGSSSTMARKLCGCRVLRPSQEEQLHLNLSPRA